MIIGFKEGFVEPIINGTKIHTIREDVHNRWKEGMKMHMATGVRTKKYHQFNEKICLSTQKIEIIHQNCIKIIKINNRKLKLSELYILAKNDGFANYDDFYFWFDKDFTGKIIHWTNLKY